MRQPTLERKVTFWLVLILLSVVLGTLVSRRELRNIIRNDDDVIHSYDVLDSLSDTMSLVKDAETGERGYLITGSEIYLEPYDQAVSSINQHLQQLRSLTAGDPVAAPLVALLSEHVSTKLSELSESIGLRRRVSFEAAQALVLTDEGKRTMDATRRVSDIIETHETNLLHDRLAQSAASGEQAQFIVYAVGGLALVLIVVFYVQVRRGVSARAILLRREEQAREAAELAFQSERDARDRAEQASRLKDEFLATVSHELRTPLNAILGWSRMLRAGTVGPDAAPRGLESIERNATAQAQLIEDLLDISRIVAGRLRLEVMHVDLAPVVQAAVDAVKPAADARDIAIAMSSDKSAVQVSGDPQRLQQVVWNLLSNSIKFTPPGGHVEVELERTDSEARITVRDSGQGIGPEFLPHVFELFRQADGGPSRKHGGLGLGLAIVRRIVEMHGGSIRAASDGDGAGATFTVELPLLSSKSAPAPAPSLPKATESGSDALSLAGAPRLEGLRILAVDDQRDTLDVIETILIQRGAAVRTCASAAEALELVQEWRPDVLVADLGLPGEDGYALIERVRNLTPSRGGNTPAIALTAYTRVEDRMKTLSAGYQMHVPKPVEPAELVTIVASLAGRQPSPTTV